mgnify:FL=1
MLLCAGSVRKQSQSIKLAVRADHDDDDARRISNTPIRSTTVETLRWERAVIETATRKVLAGETAAAYALTTFPGHHSNRDQFGGYCFVRIGLRRLFDVRGLVADS